MGIGDTTAVIEPYELSLIETTDDLELFVFWRECRIANENVWARLLPADLAVRLFDAGVRSVAAVAALTENDTTLTAAAKVPEYRSALVEAARDWVPLPAAWRREAAGTYGLRVPDTVERPKDGAKR